MTALSVVMPCCDRAGELRRVLQAYDRQVGDAPFELIAVDDASTDETPATLASHRATRYALRILQQPRRAGPAAARNRGIEAAAAPVVLFVGDDVRPGPTLVAEHLRAHREHAATQTAILGLVRWPEDLPQSTLMTHIDGVGSQQFGYRGLRPGQDCGPRHFYTANVSAKRAALGDERFDPDFPHAAFEDFELAYRLWRARGLSVIFAPAAVADHYHYHTVYSFAERQRRVGMMLQRVIGKHPELPTLHPLFRTRGFRALGRIAALQRRRRLAAETARAARWLDAQALHVASAYEWRPHPLVDSLYAGLLGHHRTRGVIAAMFAEAPAAASIEQTWTVYHLGAVLLRFLLRARRSPELPQAPIGARAVWRRVEPAFSTPVFALCAALVGARRLRARVDRRHQPAL